MYQVSLTISRGLKMAFGLHVYFSHSSDFLEMSAHRGRSWMIVVDYRRMTDVTMFLFRHTHLLFLSLSSPCVFSLVARCCVRDVMSGNLT